MSNNQNEDSQVNYDLSFLKNKKWITSLTLLFVIILFSHFSITEKIDSAIASALNSNPRCQIAIGGYEINLFPLPHIQVNDINIPKQCSNGLPKDFYIPRTRAYFRGPSFSPFGPHFKIETNFNNNPLSFYISSNFSFTDAVILMENNEIEIENFSEFIPLVAITGTLNTNVQLSLRNQEVKNINLNIISKNLDFPAQNIMGFDLQAIPVNRFQLSIDATDPKSSELKNLVLGDDNSPLRAELKGKIKLNTRSIESSGLNLKGQFAISEEFISDPSMFLLKNMISQFDKKDNFYQIRISGTFARPQTK